MHEKRTYANLELKKKPFSLEGRISRIYDRISNYGQNIAMPFLMLLVLNLWVGLIFQNYFSNEIIWNPKTSPIGWTHSFPPWAGLVLQNIFHPFSQFKINMPYLSRSVWVFLISILQTLGSALFLTLGFLAIRRKFKKESE